MKRRPWAVRLLKSIGQPDCRLEDRRKPERKTTKATIFRPHHIAIYNGKQVPMDYASNPKDQFKRACQRIADNNAEGYVVTPDNKAFAITRASRMAKAVTGADAQKIIRSVGGL